MFGIKSKARRQLARDGELAGFRNRSEIAPTQAAKYDEKYDPCETTAGNERRGQPKKRPKHEQPDQA
jgi:hypothetical protein